MIKALKLLIIFVIVVVANHSYAQKQLSSNISSDSAFSLAESIQFKDPDSAIRILTHYLADTLHLSKADIWKKNDIICMAYLNTGKYAKADSLATKNMQYFSNKQQEVASYLMLGRTSNRIKNGKEKSLKYFIKAEKASRTIGDTNSLLRALVNLGYTYLDYGATSKASSSLMEAVEISEIQNDQTGIANAKGALANVFSEVSDYEKAYEYNQGAISSFKKMGNKQALVSFYINAANNLGMLKEYEKELLILDSAALVNSKLNNRHLEIIIDYNKALTLFNLERFNESQVIVNNALTTISNLKIQTHEYGRLLGLKARINIKLKNFHEAQQYMDSALIIATQTNDLNGQYNMYIDLSELYAAQNKYQLSNKNLSKSIEIYKELRTLEKDKTVKNLEIIYETKKKEQTIELQNAELEVKAIALENERIKKYFLVVTLLLMVVIFMVFYVYQQKIQKRKEEAEINRKEKEIAKYKLLVVNNQISPHFTFNAIHSLQGLIAHGKKDQAIDAFSMFANLIKATLQGADSYTNSLESEIEFIRLFLEFMAYKYDHKFSYEINVDKQVNTAFIIPRLAIQELVENSIKHGIRHKQTNDGLVQINIEQTKGHYIFTVTDNGVGMKYSSQHHGEGMGKGSYLNNMINNIFNKANKRPSLRYIENLFDEDNNPIGTKVVLKIPIEYTFKM